MAITRIACGRVLSGVVAARDELSLDAQQVAGQRRATNRESFGLSITLPRCSLWVGWAT